MNTKLSQAYKNYQEEMNQQYEDKGGYLYYKEQHFPCYAGAIANGQRLKRGLARWGTRKKEDV